MHWVKHLHGMDRQLDVLIVAGDISDNLVELRATLKCLKDKFAQVFFVPGNHELWVNGRGAGGPQDSIAKLQAVYEVCTSLGVAVGPQRIGRLWIVPLLSWHHKSFDREPDILGIPKASALTIADYARCAWPADVRGPPEGDAQGSLAIASWFDSLNDALGWLPPHLSSSRSPSHRSSSSPPSSPPAPGPASEDAAGLPSARHGGYDVITFSHFLPDQRLLPEKRFLTYPNLAKAVGSEPLGARVRALAPHLHVFGHTHFSWDATLHGVRYIQAPLCYPGERQARLRSLAMSGHHHQERHHQQQAGAPAPQDCEIDNGNGSVPWPHAAGGHGHGTAAGWLPVCVYQASCSLELLPGKELQAHVGPGATRGSPKPAVGGPDCHPAVAAGGYSLLCSADPGLLHGGPGGRAGSWSGSSAGAYGQMHLHASAGSPPGTPCASSCESTSANVGGSSTCSSTSAICRSLLGGSGDPSPADERQACAAAGASSASGAGAVRVVVRSWQSAWCPELGAMWSDHYKQQPRKPEVVDLAPWVAKRYSGARQRRIGLAQAEGSAEASNVPKVEVQVQAVRQGS